MKKYLVRGGFILSIMAAFVLFIYASDLTEGDLIMTDSSEVQLDQIVDNSDQTNRKKGSKKLVKKTVLETPAGAGAAAVLPAALKTSAVMNKGSFSATAYCLKGRTALGHGVRRGIIAADPRILKLGSRVVVSAGSYSGEYLVSDTGGGVKGKEIDIWVPNCAEARRFGRRTVTISLSEN